MPSNKEIKKANRAMMARVPGLKSILQRMERLQEDSLELQEDLAALEQLSSNLERYRKDCAALGDEIGKWLADYGKEQEKGDA